MATGFSLLSLSFFLTAVLGRLLAGTSYFSLVDIPRPDASDPHSMLISITLVAVFGLDACFSVFFYGEAKLAIDFPVFAPADEFLSKRLGPGCFEVFYFSKGFASVTLGLAFTAVLLAPVTLSLRLAISFSYSANFALKSSNLCIQRSLNLFRDCLKMPYLSLLSFISVLFRLLRSFGPLAD